MPLLPGNLFGLVNAPASETGADNSAGSVVELLKQLEGFSVPERPQIGRGRRVLGRIGDALLAAATVKAGGVPSGIGPFAARLQRREQEFQDQSAQAVAANRDLRNRIRIGDFQARRQARASEKEFRIRARADIAKEKTKIAADIRRALIDKIVNLNVNTQGKDLLTTPTNELKTLLDKHDPSAAISAVIESLPDDLELDNVRINKDGTISVQSKRKGEGKELPVGIIKTLIDAGQDPSLFIKDKKLAAQLKQVAAGNRKTILSDNSVEFLDNIKTAAEDNPTKFNGTPDIVNQATASAATDLKRLVENKANDNTLRQYYRGEVNQAARLFSSNVLSEQESAEYLSRLRQILDSISPNIDLQMTTMTASPSVAIDKAIKAAK